MLMAASTATKGETMEFLMLPDDLLFNCLARVSRLYYPTLALVSKRFRSLIASLERYKTRTLLGYTESCLYVCLYFLGESNPIRWFTLCRKTIQIPKLTPRWFTPFVATYTSRNENYLLSVPTRISPHVDWWKHKCIVTLGCKIYYIGGFNNGLPSSRVVYMDCQSHTWHEAPSMRMARMYPQVSVVDGKIYVMESCRNPDFSNLVECFDPKTQIWEHVPSPDAKIRGTFMYKSLAIELPLFGNKSVGYKPEENKWDEVEQLWIEGLNICVIDNIYFRYRFSRKFQWYDFEARTWRALKGLKKLPKLPNSYDSFRFVDHGGKIAVLWENVVDEKKTIWCAVISFEQHNKHEIHGRIEWCDIVLTIPNSCYLLQFSAVTV